MRRTRPVDVARFGLGLAALSRPDLLLHLTKGPHSALSYSAATRRTVRLLGARYVVQSGGGMILERPWLPEADALVDLVHMASMLGLAALSRNHRRLALLSAGAAVVFAGADLQERAG